MMEANRNGYGFFALSVAFAVGGLAGAAFGLLFAPRTGEETRDRIKERAEGAGERMRETAKTVRGRAEEVFETGKEKYGEFSEKVLGFTDRMIEKFFPGGKEDEVRGN